jgi:hypothetical protein
MAEPSPEAIAEADDVFAELMERADVVGSFSRSIAEAAFRQDVVQLRLYRFQFHHTVVELMRLIRTVAPIDGAK